MDYKVILCIVAIVGSFIALVFLTWFLVYKIKDNKINKFNSFNNSKSSFGFKKWSKPVSYYALSILWLTLLLVFIVAVGYVVTYS